MPHRSLGHRAPLLWLVLPLSCGLVTGKVGELAPAGWLLGGAGVLALGAFVAATKSRVGWAVGLSAALFLAGMASYSLHRARLPAWDALPPREAILTVRVDRVFPQKFQNRVSTLAMVIRAEPHLSELVNQRLYCGLTLRKGDTAPIRSSHLRVVGVIETLPRNPPLNTFDGYLAGAGMNFRLTRARILNEERPPTTYARFRARSVDRFKTILGLGIAGAHPELAGVLRAMMLGETQELTEEQDALFMQSGTMHLFAISGLNIGLIALAIDILLRLARAPGWLRLGLSLVALWFYVDMTGVAPSAVRAFLMVALWQCALLARVPQSGLSALTASAVLVLIFAPLQFFSASFQMSYAILASLLLLGQPLADCWLSAWAPFRDLPEVTWRWWHHAGAWVWKNGVTVFAFGLASATISTVTGILFFNLFTPGAFLANMLCIPAGSLVIMSGFLSVLSGLVGFESWCSVFNHASAMLLAGIDVAIRAGVRVPGAWAWAQFKELWLGNVAFAATMITLLWGYMGEWRWRRGGWLPPFVVVALTVACGVSFVPKPAPAKPDPKKPVHRGAKVFQVAPMKSAYELAMERLAKSDPAGKPLTAEQKGRLAEIDRVYQGKLAEREIFLKKLLNDVLAEGKADEVAKIQQQLANERARIEEERDAEKDRVRSSG